MLLTGSFLNIAGLQVVDYSSRLQWKRRGRCASSRQQTSPNAEGMRAGVTQLSARLDADWRLATTLHALGNEAAPMPASTRDFIRRRPRFLNVGSNEHLDKFAGGPFVRASGPGRQTQANHLRAHAVSANLTNGRISKHCIPTFFEAGIASASPTELPLRP